MIIASYRREISMVFFRRELNLCLDPAMYTLKNSWVFADLAAAAVNAVGELVSQDFRRLRSLRIFYG